MPQVSPPTERDTPLRTDRRLDPFIEAYVPEGARVIDLGCGSGELLMRLLDSKQINARGVEITGEGIKACIEKGLSVYQGDLDDGFEDFDAGVFDIVILNQTLSMLYHPDAVLSEMVRIGKRAIVTFYNAGYLPRRHRFLHFGNVGALLPEDVPWYRNPHIHPFSVRDFEELCAERRIRVVERTFLDEGLSELGGVTKPWPQDWAFAGVYLLERR